MPEASPTVFGAVEWLAEIDSTNQLLLERAREGAPAGLVVVADHQTAGRGRLGRTWVAPPGASLLMSLLLRPAIPVDRRHVLVMTAGLAMAEAVEAETGVVAGLKWPNDLLVGDRKLAGILAEATGDALVIGIGVNIDWHEVPEELRAIATACNLEGGRASSREAIVRTFLDGYAVRLTDLETARRDYEARLVTLGRRVRVVQSGAEVVGVARGVDPSGHLVLDLDDGSRSTITVGDVIHVRPAE